MLRSVSPLFSIPARTASSKLSGELAVTSITFATDIACLLSMRDGAESLAPYLALRHCLREVLERLAGLRLLLSRQVDAALGQERPRLCDDLRRLCGRALRRELEDPGHVREGPQLGHESAREPRRRELELDDVDRAERDERVELDARGSTFSEEAPLLGREQLADRTIAGHRPLDVPVVRPALQRAGADERAWHRVDLHAELGRASQLTRELVRNHRAELHRRVAPFADAARPHDDARLGQSQVQGVEEDDLPDLGFERIHAE